ncbi:MAG: hypothetical protein OEV42_10200 [Deltaproteobacteria bacterium]|nr:hypothetical protein [Deltaproteobacteria bacterium]
MNEKMKIFLFIITVMLSLPYAGTAQSFEIRGELSGWLTWRDNVPDDYLLGMRYIPEVTLSPSLFHNSKLDFMASVNAGFEAPTDRLVVNDDTSDVEFYRLWGRWSTKQFEARGGLQKINFGPARILRSLMWFDRIDPRDPFGLTEGVKGVLMRRYFVDNSNIWLWGLYGNDEVKGLEDIETDEETPEYGGRYQFPVEKGELAFSYHHRKIEKKVWLTDRGPARESAREDRIACDGFRDIGVGLWFESVAGRTAVDGGVSLWSEFLTVGADYTFGTGIHLLGEHFLMAAGPDWDETAGVNSISAFSADYAVNILDSVNTIITYDWFNYKSQSFLGWQRTYDDWRINALAFSGPQENAGKFRGDGLQIIVTYNH